MSKPRSKTKAEREAKAARRQSQREQSNRQRAIPSNPEQKQVTEPAQKKPPGRPVTRNIKETCKAVTVRLPIELLDKYNETRDAIGADKTNYITKLIKEDMDAHYEERKLKTQYIHGEISIDEYNQTMKKKIIIDNGNS